MLASPSKANFRPFFPAIDLLRAVAASLVVIGHLRNLFFVDYAEVSNGSLLTKLCYFGTGLGHQAVIIFFVLSGLLVGGKALTQIQQGNFHWGRYLIDRTSRLCIVLWPALLLTFVCDSLSVGVFNIIEKHLSLNMGDNLIPNELGQTFSLVTYLGNAFFLQKIFVMTAGTNGPLWSLSFEFWFYMAFPSLLLSFWPGIATKTRIQNMLVLAVVGYFISHGMKTNFSIWMMGAAVTLGLGRIHLGKGRVLHLGLALASLFAALAYSRFYPHPYDGIPLGMATAYLCWAIQSFPTANVGRVMKWGSFFSSFSYSLYLCHLPVLILIRATMAHTPRWQLEPLTSIYGLGIYVLVMGVSYLMYRCTEYHTPNLRRYLTHKFMGSSPKDSGMKHAA